MIHILIWRKVTLHVPVYVKTVQNVKATFIVETVIVCTVVKDGANQNLHQVQWDEVEEQDQ